jgi:hypothetical protein
MNTIKSNKDTIIAGTVGAVTTPVVTVGGIKLLGFTAAGIGKGTAAATLMAKIGGALTTKGGVIAISQSIGAAGLGVTGIALTATGGAIIIGGGYMLYKYKGDVILSAVKSKL